MATVVTDPGRAEAAPRAELPLFASWVNLFAAAVIYICSNPGRTYGLGVVTEPILEDFQLSRTSFGQINFWATVVVAVLSFGFGTVIDRLGSYRAAWALTLLTAAATLFTALAGGYWALFAAITLARLFGQGILSIVSTGILGKSFSPRHAPMAAAVYLLLTSALYGGVVYATKLGLLEWHMTWREVWLGIAGLMAFVALPISLLLISPPTVPPPDRAAMRAENGGDRTVWQAVRSPLFIVYGLYCLVSGAAGSGIALFNESLLKDRGFGREVFFDSLLIGIVSMVAFKFVVAWLCQRWSMGKVLAAGMLLTAGAYGSVSLLDTATDVYVWSLVKAVAMAIHVVVYFSIWVYAFGRRDLAQIQGAIHVVTITASGVGPLVLAVCRDRLGSYLPCLYVGAGLSLVLGLAMLFVRVPCADPRKGAGAPPDAKTEEAT